MGVSGSLGVCVCVCVCVLHYRRLHGYRGGFLSSTLQNLAHFLEDKSAPQVLPLEISVRDTHVDLKVGTHTHTHTPSVLTHSSISVASVRFGEVSSYANEPTHARIHNLYVQEATELSTYCIYST